MSVARPTAKELMDAARTLRIGLFVADGRLVISGATPEAHRTLWAHRRAIVRRILAGRGAA